MQGNPVVWFEIYVHDMPRARRFYESVLARKLEKLNAPEGEMWAFPMTMEATGAAGALVKMDGAGAGGNSVMVYFACDDCVVEAGRVEESGGRLEQPKKSIGEYGFIAIAVDPDGNRFGLHSMR